LFFRLFHFFGKEQLMKLLQRFWADEAGFVVSSELVLVATMLVIGLCVGLTSLRNQVVQELVDTGAAIGMFSQGYEYTGTIKTGFAQTDGSGWDDLLDECQAATGADVTLEEPGDIDVQAPAEVANNAAPGEQ